MVSTDRDKILKLLSRFRPEIAARFGVKDLAILALLRRTGRNPTVIWMCWSSLHVLRHLMGLWT